MGKSYAVTENEKGEKQFVPFEYSFEIKPMEKEFVNGEWKDKKDQEIDKFENIMEAEKHLKK